MPKFDLSIFDDYAPPETEHEFYEGQKGILGDLGSALLRGSEPAISGVGHAAEAVGFDNELKNWKLTGYLEEVSRPDIDTYIGEDSWLRKSTIGAFESLPQTIAGMGTGMVVGGSIGGIPGAIVGGMASTLGLFGLGEGHRAYEEGLEMGLSEQDAKEYGFKTGAIEGGIEALASGLEIAIGAGVGKAINPVRLARGFLKSTPKKLAKDTLRHSLGTTGRQYLTAAGGEVVTETGTEMLQGVLGAGVREQYGMPTEGKLEAAFESFGPALIMSLMFAGGASGYSYKRQRQMMTALNSEDKGTRTKAASIISQNLQREDKDVALAWSKLATDRIESGAKFDINENFLEATRDKTQISDEDITNDPEATEEFVLDYLRTPAFKGDDRRGIAYERKRRLQAEKGEPIAATEERELARPPMNLRRPPEVDERQGIVGERVRRLQAERGVVVESTEVVAGLARTPETKPVVSPENRTQLYKKVEEDTGKIPTISEKETLKNELLDAHSVISGTSGTIFGLEGEGLAKAEDKARELIASSVDNKVAALLITGDVQGAIEELTLHDDKKLHEKQISTALQVATASIDRNQTDYINDTIEQVQATLKNFRSTRKTEGGIQWGMKEQEGLQVISGEDKQSGIVYTILEKTGKGRKAQKKEWHIYEQRKGEATGPTGKTARSAKLAKAIVTKELVTRETESGWRSTEVNGKKATQYKNYTIINKGKNKWWLLKDGKHVKTYRSQNDAKISVTPELAKPTKTGGKVAAKKEKAVREAEESLVEIKGEGETTKPVNTVITRFGETTTGRYNQEKSNILHFTTQPDKLDKTKLAKGDREKVSVSKLDKSARLLQTVDTTGDLHTSGIINALEDKKLNITQRKKLNDLRKAFESESKPSDILEQEAVSLLRGLGYDGIVYENTVEGGEAVGIFSDIFSKTGEVVEKPKTKVIRRKRGERVPARERKVIEEKAVDDFMEEHDISMTDEGILFGEEKDPDYEAMDDDPDNTAYYSSAKDEGIKGSTAKEVKVELEKILGTKKLQKLIDSGKLTIAPANTPSNAKATYDPNTDQITLYPANIEKGKAFNVLAHEVVHENRGKIWSERINREVYRRFAELRKTDDKVAEAFAQAASAWVGQYGTTDPNIDWVLEEAMAYYLESEANAKTSIYRDILTAIKRFLIKHLGIRVAPYLKGRDLIDIYSREALSLGTKMQKTRVSTDVKQSYVGEKAKLKPSDLLGLEWAKKMKGGGATNKEIRKETGWFFRKEDQKWRFELDDTGLKFKIDTSSMTKEDMKKLMVKGMALGDFIDHPILKQYHPSFFSDIRIYLDPTTSYEASFNPSTFAIDLSLDNLNDGSVLLHEIQHAIQMIESFAVGANADQLFNDMKGQIGNRLDMSMGYLGSAKEFFFQDQESLGLDRDQILNDFEVYLEEQGDKLWDHPAYREIVEDWSFKDIVLDAQHLDKTMHEEAPLEVLAIREFSNFLNSNYFRGKWNPSVQHMKDFTDNAFKHAKGYLNLYPQAQRIYMATAGEVEARDVGERYTLGMEGKDLSKIDPFETQKRWLSQTPRPKVVAYEKGTKPYIKALEGFTFSSEAIKESSATLPTNPKSTYDVEAALDRYHGTESKTPASVTATNTLKGFFDKIGESVSPLLEGVTEGLRKIDEGLVVKIRKMELEIADKNKEYGLKIGGFAEKYGKLKEKDRILLDFALRNPNTEDQQRVKDILKTNNMTEDYKKVREVLEEIWERMESVGLNTHDQTEAYFPRRVNDIQGLIKFMKNDEAYGLIQKEIDAARHQARLDGRGDKWGVTDEMAIVTRILNTGRYYSLTNLKKPTSVKSRRIQRVTVGMGQFYTNSIDTLLGHIHEANEAIETRKFTGSSPRAKYIKEQRQIIKDLDDGALSVEEKNEMVGRFDELTKKLEDKERELDDSVGAMLLDKLPNLDGDQQLKAKELIKARLGQRGMSGSWAALRNIALGSALASPTSAITQIGDLAFIVYNNGLINTVGAIFGKKKLTKEDFNLTHTALTEFQQEGTAKFVDKVLKLTGLQWMDMMGKEASMNAALNKAEKMNPQEFHKKWGTLFNGDKIHSASVLKDIKSGNYKTSDVRFLVFWELSQFQPVSLSEMSSKYLTAGNNRIFYMLKSYNIKALNTMWREVAGQFKAGNKVQAMKNLSYLLILLTMAGATADELKEFLTGRDESFSEHVHENLMKIAFINRYSMTGASKKGFAKTFLKDVLVPPTGFFDEPFSDLINLFPGGEEPSYNTLKALPYGRVFHGLVTPQGREAKEDFNKKQIYKRIRTSVSSGDYASVRRDINIFNRNVGNKKDAEGKSMKITSKMIKNIKQKERKKLKEKN